MNFMPDGYDKLHTQRSYWKMSEMKDGDNKFRIVAKPIAGWIDWKDKKPYRYKPENKPAQPFDSEMPIKPFWALYVWDYAREGLYILEITQSSLIKALTNYATDEDWGDFTQYDFKLRKEGSGKDTKYFISPLPHKPLSEKIKNALATIPVRLEALYESGDPWNDLEPKSLKISPEEAEKILSLIGDDEAYKQKILNAYKMTEFTEIPATALGIILQRVDAHNKKRLAQEMGEHAHA